MAAGEVEPSESRLTEPLDHHLGLKASYGNSHSEDEIESEEGTAEATGPELRTCIDLPQAGRRDASLEEIKLRDITRGYGKNVSNRAAPSLKVVDEHRHTVGPHQVVGVSGESLVLPALWVTCGRTDGGTPQSLEGPECNCNSKQGGPCQEERSSDAQPAGRSSTETETDPGL
ncbi:hypothetical protein EYF80_003151 [Liparis tanakae]|uniref:Uncharacterized protein n=1 Tax=Liparis tanakae TaxID=230148 RepID=A0A4Z2JAC5_9TELE|nr:hypothetical protein EYF80_003151 [Liparis tanakae]